MLMQEYESPCGELILGVCGSEMVMCDWKSEERINFTLKRIKKYLLPSENKDDESILESAVNQLNEYFAGNRKEFSLPLNPAATEFQRAVINELMQVGYGGVTTYKAIAERIRKPYAVRAVANAIGSNPLSILIPCHRIIGSGGLLGGYAGGLEAKKYLLNLESGTAVRF